jgi:hypothetical protein
MLNLIKEYKMMKAFKIFSMAAVAFMMYACSSEDTALENAPVAGGKMHFTATIAAPNSGASTRTTYTEITESTDPDYGKIKVAREQDDEIALIHNGTKDVVKVQTIHPDGSATISGDITVDTDGEIVIIVYPAAAVDAPESGSEPVYNATYNTKWLSQDGTLGYIQDNLDYCDASSTLKVCGTEVTLSDNISLESSIAIVKFSLTDGTNPLAATQFLIRDGSYDVVAAVTPSTGTASTFYVALPPAVTGTTSTFRFKATTATSSYYYSKYGATVDWGKYYQSQLTMLDMLHTPLTLEATVNETTVTITNNSGVNFSYTVNGGDPVSTSADATITLQSGDIVQFNSTNSALGVNSNLSIPSSINALSVRVDKKSYVYGNVMSMVNDAGDFATDVTLADYAMPRLFSGDWSASNHIDFLADKPLMLPATNISKYCYSGMFAHCEELSTLPSGFLPATVMQEGCYRFMFDQCSGLTTLPDDLLPAGGSGEGSLAKLCYKDMFQSCSGLTTLADDFLPATTLAEECYEAMFSGCSGLTHAPILRAPTLEEGCYDTMFGDCRKLSEVTCLATNISALNCLANWLSYAGSNVSGTKTLYVDPSMMSVGTDGDTGQWYLSDGWTLATDYAHLTSANIGNVLAANGNIYANAAAATAAGTTAVAMITYVGNATGETSFTHGLALALSDANGGSTCSWSTSTSTVHAYHSYSSSFESESGLQYNSYDPDHNSDTYPAFKYAIANNGTIKPTNCSAWFLPTAYQWNQMINACMNVLGTKNSYEDLRDGFSGVGGTNLRSGRYWSSTEYDSSAWIYFFIDDKTWGLGDKYHGLYYVRSALAF